MDNMNQSKDGGVQQPATSPQVAEQAGPGTGKAAAPVTNLGVNNPGTVPVPSPLTGPDVSLTVPEYGGGPIDTTEVGSK